MPIKSQKNDNNTGSFNILMFHVPLAHSFYQKLFPKFLKQWLHISGNQIKTIQSLNIGVSSHLYSNKTPILTMYMFLGISNCAVTVSPGFKLGNLKVSFNQGR